MSSLDFHQAGAGATPHGIAQKRNSRLIFNTIPRLWSSVPRTGKVERPSVYTRNSSLPGRYSHRRRTLLERDETPEVYWTSADTNMRGVMVSVVRAPTTVVVNLPWGRSIQFCEMFGSMPSRGEISTRPRNATLVRPPP